MTMRLLLVRLLALEVIRHCWDGSPDWRTGRYERKKRGR